MELVGTDKALLTFWKLRGVRGMHDVKENMPKAYTAPERLHTKNTHQLPCPQESHWTKKFPRLRPPMSQNIPKHGLQPASFMHACKKILECYLTLPLPWLLLNSALLVPEENTPWAAFLGSGEPQGYQVATPLVWPLFTAVSTNFVVDVRFLC